MLKSGRMWILMASLVGPFFIQNAGASSSFLFSPVKEKIGTFSEFSEFVFFQVDSSLSSPSPATKELNNSLGTNEFNEPNDPLWKGQWWAFNYGQVIDPPFPGPRGSQDPQDAGYDQAQAPGISGADMKLGEALNIYRPQQDIVLAILDSGLSWDHEDLSAEMLWENPGESGKDQQGREKQTNGIDDDGNGRIDDVHGWNFVDNNHHLQDQKNHGTQIAGLLQAVQNNGKGLFGMGLGMKIMVLKTFSHNQVGNDQQIAEAIRYSCQQGAKILSNSYGSPSWVEEIHAAISFCRDRGVLFISAVGNSRINIDHEPIYPASYQLENQISVGATNNQDFSPPWSNWGQTVDLLAPGENLLTLLPPQNGQHLYSSVSGTSFAAPLVAGAAAMVWSQSPHLSFYEVKERLLQGADERPRLKRWGKNGRRLNLFKALLGVRGLRLPRYDFSTWKEKEQVIETSHPYKKGKKITHLLHIPEARRFRLHFSRFETVSEMDPLILKDFWGREVDVLEGKLGEVWTEVIEGQTATLIFESSPLIFAWGFRLDKIQYQE